MCQFGPLEPIFLPPPCISIPRTQLAQNNAVPIKGNSKGLPQHLLLHRKFKPPKDVIVCFPSHPCTRNTNLIKTFKRNHKNLLYLKSFSIAKITRNDSFSSIHLPNVITCLYLYVPTYHTKSFQKLSFFHDNLSMQQHVKLSL